MYLNHFDYFKHMTKALCEEVENYPSHWRCPAPDEMVPPAWIQEASRGCETLLKEVLVVTGEAKDVRKLVCRLFQHLPHKRHPL